jgi:tight adherence protein B
MSSSAIMLAMIFLLSACSVGGLLLIALYPRMSAHSVLRRRTELISAVGRVARPRRGAVNENRRKRSVEATLRAAEEELDTTRRGKSSLLARLRQGNLGWSRSTYYAVCGASGIIVFVLVLSTGLGMLAAAGSSVAGLMLPYGYVSFRRNRRLRHFATEFPNAVDVIVRGIQAGLPLVDCLKIVAAEAQEPVKGEFKILMEDQALGMPLDQAVQRLPARMPLPEANFFAVVIAIQSHSGGSLAEALANLSDMLRERKKMQAKVKALSGEAKASSYIIGGLPFVIGGLLYLLSPDYIGLLFTTQTGNVVLAACVVMMLSGIFVMRKMMNFEI